jgi:hypothetical protein
MLVEGQKENMIGMSCKLGRGSCRVKGGFVGSKCQQE